MQGAWSNLQLDGVFAPCRPVIPAQYPVVAVEASGGQVKSAGSNLSGSSPSPRTGGDVRAME
jgi:hypothetical protein